MERLRGLSIESLAACLASATPAAKSLIRAVIDEKRAKIEADRATQSSQETKIITEKIESILGGVNQPFWKKGEFLVSTGLVILGLILSWYFWYSTRSARDFSQAIVTNPPPSNFALQGISNVDLIPSSTQSVAVPTSKWTNQVEQQVLPKYFE